MTAHNQIALANVAETWIAQSQILPDLEAARRLGAKVRLIQDKIEVLGRAACRDEEPPADVAGLSVVDLMAAQSRLVVERNVRARMAGVAA